MDGEIKDIIYSTTYLDEKLELHTISNKENKFEYRNSIFQRNNNYIIISAIIKLEKGKQEEIKQKMDENMKLRKERQPLEYPSAGSIFKRNDKFIPAMIIDQLGLKGYNIKDACISEKHAGFIINKGKAKSEDVLKLIEFIKKKIKEKFNEELKLEIEILGED